MTEATEQPQESQAPTQPEPPPKKKRTLLRVFLVLVVLGLIAVGGAAGWYFWAIGPADGAGAQVNFRVPKGATAGKVGGLLAEKNLLKSKLAWKVYLKLNAAPAPKAGLHKVSAAMDVEALLEALSGPPIIEDMDVTLVEGWRLRDADKALTAKGMIAAGAYQSAATSPDKYKVPFEIEGGSLAGYLLPDTYKAPALDGKLAVDGLVQMQVDAFWTRFAKPNAAEIKASGRSLRDLVILASLLEREEPKPKNRPKVAGVMYRRLDSNTPLGVDATSRFTLENWNDRKAFLKKLRDPSDPYNTRLRKGLPPTPIGAPSLSSLEAALRPVKSPYWYYLHDSDGNIHFAKDWRQHEANRKRYNVY